MSYNPQIKKRRNREGRSTLEFLRSTLVPADFCVVPPQFFDVPNYVQQITIDGEFKMDDSALVNEKVKTTSGMILWYPRLHSTSIFRMGFVEATTSVACGVRGLVFTSALPFTALTFNKKLAIPYGNKPGAGGTTDYIRTSPNAAANFSLCRAISGMINLQSDAVPISTGTNVYTGLGSMGLISDTRDICQTTTGNCWDPSDLKTQSMVPKDGYNQTSIPRGMVSLLGPDYAFAFSSPELNQTDDASCQFVQMNLISAPITKLSAGAFTTVGERILLYTGWISPWDCTISPSAEDAAPYNYKVNTIDETDCLDLDLRVQMQIPVGTATALHSIQFVFTSVYATCQSDGSMNYVCNAETHNAGIVSGNAIEIGNRVYVGKHKPRQYCSGFVQTGKYLGTLVRIEVMSVAASFVQVQYKINQISCAVGAHHIGVDGAVGPCHVLAWNSVSNGQQLRVNGCVNLQTMPSGNIAQFTHDSADGTHRAGSLNAVTLVETMYNQSHGLIRRNWIYDEYMEKRNQYFLNNLSPAIIQELSDYNENISAAAESAGVPMVLDKTDAEEFGAGLIGDWGRSLGNIIGSVIPGVGDAIGQGLGKVGDFAGDVAQQLGEAAVPVLIGGAMSGMSGAFGSAGQFGQIDRGGYGSAGQFGQIQRGGFGAEGGFRRPRQ